MFSNGAKGETVIAEGLRIEGNVIADGHIMVHGTIVGDLRCASLEISQKANVTGGVIADSVTIDGNVEGPVRGADVTLKPHAHVVGDIHHTSLTIEKGARFDGRSKQADSAGGGRKEEKPVKRAAAAE